MLNKLSPFFAIIISIPLLKEKPSKMDITATIIAFIGALFIIRPTGNNLQLVPSFIGLYGGFGAGTAYVFVRRATGKGARNPVIVICFSLFSCILTLPFLIFNFVYMTPTSFYVFFTTLRLCKLIFIFESDMIKLVYVKYVSVFFE